MIGGDGSILDFVIDADERPCRLVISGKDIVGLVSLSDLQKLSVRAALFALVTGLEVSMTKAIGRSFPTDDDWKSPLNDRRSEKVDSEITLSHRRDKFVDALLFTQFCDKVEILRKGVRLPQKTAWHLEHRIREAFTSDDLFLSGEFEVDETYIGGKRANMSNAKRKALAGTGRGTVGKAAVVGLRERGGHIVAMPVKSTEKDTLQPIIEDTVEAGSSVYTDEHGSYVGLHHAFDYETVKHSAGEYVKDRASTNGVESFWALVKRGYYGTHHFWSFKHRHRYVAEYVYQHNTIMYTGLEALAIAVTASGGKHLSYSHLIQP